MKKSLLQLPLFAMLLILVWSSCKKEEEPPYVKDGNSPEYYPLGINKYVVYDVDSVIWNEAECEEIRTTARIRYTLVDSFWDDKGRLTYRIETRIHRGELGWKPGTVYYVAHTEAGLEYVENGLRFLKLVFPVESGYTWKGNMMIPAEDRDLAYLRDWNYHYLDVGMPFSYEGRSFDNTATVVHVDRDEGDPEADPAEPALRLHSREVYARGVGLVHRVYTYWTYDPATRCKSGVSVTMREVEHN